MANKLTELTDRVLKEVIKNEVILPSTYKEHFENHAREMQIDLNYENIVNEETQRQLNEATALTEKSYCNLDTLQKSTKDAQEAIRDKDMDRLALITQEISGLKTALDDLKTQLYTDTLTNTYNRKWLMENLLSNGEFVSNGMLAFIDIDKFKPINDKFGRVIGDKVLQYLVGFLKTSLKGMDIVRYAGDEFIVVSQNIHIEECYLRLKHLQVDLLSKKLKAANGELLYLSFSFGMARFEAGTNFRDTLEIADSLMRENKKNKNAS